jgi:hypothetical protein
MIADIPIENRNKVSVDSRDAMLESINEGDFDDKIHESNIEGDYCEPEYREH